MASYDITAQSTALEFDTANGKYNSCYQIDSNHFINFWSGDGDDGYTQVFEVNESTKAITAKGTPLEFDTVNGAFNSCFKIDSNHFINFWSGAGSYGYTQVFEVNLSTWAVTAKGSALQFETSVGVFNSCFKIDSNHFINFWRGANDDGFVQVFEVNLSTWAVTAKGTAVEFDTAYNASNSCYQIDSNHFINFYAGAAGSYGYTQVFEVNLSTWAVTVKPRLQFDSNGANYNSCYQIDSNHFINFWSGAGSYGYTQVFEVNLSTWAVTAKGSVLQFHSAVNSNSCYKIDDNHFINLWSDTGAIYTQSFEVNTSTWAVTAKGSKVTVQSGATPTPSSSSCKEASDGYFTGFWSGIDSDGFTQVFSVEMPITGPANLKSYNTNLKANIKTINTNPIANVKSLNTNV